MNATTRVATEADVPALIALMREFYGEANYALDDAWAAATFSALMRDGRNGVSWIAFGEGIPIGYVVLTFRFSMEFGGIDGFVDDLFVREAYRRLGVGASLIAAVLAECEVRHILAVHVETADSNIPAVRLYKSYGLEDRGRLLLTKRLTSRQESSLEVNTAQQAAHDRGCT